ncbi:MAG: hypothetical protein ACJ74W_03305 [Pyrinomonadaceae bacterium]
MSLRLLLIITALSTSALVNLSACNSSVRLNLATPTAALKTQFAAMRARDVAAYKQTLTRQTVQWLEVKDSQADKSFAKTFAHSERAEAALEPSQMREEKLADGRVDVWVQINGQWSFERFANEAGAWKMDGFGWPYKQPPQWVKQSS